MLPGRLAEKEVRCALQSAQSVDAAVLAPPTKRLAFPPKENTERAPERNKSRVRHNGRDKSTTVSKTLHDQSYKTYPTSSLHGVMNLPNP